MKLRLSYGLIGLLIVLGIVLLSTFAGAFSHVDPYYNGPFGFLEVMDQPSAATLQAIEPHGAPVGTPEAWSKLLYGARWTLLFGVVIGLGRVALGLLVGTAAGMGGGWWKWLVGRLYLFSTAMPPLLIYLFLFALQILLPPDPAWRWPMTWLYLGIIIVLEAPRVMVVVQGRLEELQQEAFYEGALAAGNTKFRALRKHLLPHLTPTLATQFAGEVARGLLVVAALGIFHLYLMGRKVDVEEDPAGRPLGITFSALVPEWGSMLVDTIGNFRQNPAQPLIPASAFAVLVVGFTLLSDGMEAIMGRLRRPLHWLAMHVRVWQGAAGVAVVALAWLLLYFQGMPWGRAAGAEALVRAEIAALHSQQKDAFLGLIAADSAAFRAEQVQFYESLQAKQATITEASMDLKVDGNAAVGLLTMNAALPGGQVLTLERKLHLTRTLGRWRDTGYGMYLFRTRLALIQGEYDVQDPTPEASTGRGRMQMLGRLVDMTLARMLPMDPQLLADGRLPVTLFASDEQFAAALGVAKEELKGVYIWYQPGMSLRVGPSFFRGENEQLMVAVMQEQLTKLAIVRRLPNITPALVLGRAGMLNPLSKVNVGYSDHWVGGNLLSVRALLGLSVLDFSGEAGHVRQIQAMHFADWAAQQVPPAVLEQASAQAPAAALQTLAKAAGLSPEQLEAAYGASLLAHVQKLSLLTTEQGKARVPADLLRAVPLLALAEAGNNGARLTEVTPLKAIVQESHATMFVLVQWQQAAGPLAGVERWELERSGQTWTLLPRESRLLDTP